MHENEFIKMDTLKDIAAGKDSDGDD